MRSASLVGLLALACADPFPPPAPLVTGLRAVVPSDGLPAEVVPQDANNNLDLELHDGRWFLAFRTAPSHFASDETELYVVSSVDRVDWRFEGRFFAGTDLREPQLVSWNGTLHLWFAVLGTDPLAFEPQGTRHAVYAGPGDWSEPVEAFDASFIPWRIKPLDERLTVVGYTGGENVYDLESREPIQIHWLASDDAETWEPAVPGQPVVLEGGGSETDLVTLDDGTVIAVVRNEAGDADGYGSKICRAEADAPGDWTCAADPKKYDSPLLFRHGDHVWLVARRNVTETGAYDLGQDDLPPEDRYLAYQWDYWHNPKRCTVWAIDPDALVARRAVDLPSRGDTCFPEGVWQDADRLLLYNYSSPVDGPDLDWLEGQTGQTLVYEQVLDFSGE